MTGPAFKDHFSAVADAYAAARPQYPAALFDALAAVVPARARVWESGCGSGQATGALAARFAHVHATDPSAAQIAQHWGRAGFNPPSHPPPDAPLPRDLRQVESRPATNVSLAIEPGERTVLADASVQLVAVAQALHWFDREAFFGECTRVLAPGGVLAAWGYPDFIVPDGMEAAVADYRATIEPHWPPERIQIDTRYAGYDWPFPALPAPGLRLEADWSLVRFMAYLSSNSARARCLAATHIDPVEHHGAALADAWGDPESARTIRWPLFLHLRRKPER